jgi:CRP/FNR family cyclic AMP-dependent transcriptional regulator
MSVKERRVAMIETPTKFEVFRDLGSEEAHAILGLCECVRVEKGMKIFEEGEPARSLFLIQAGKVELRFKIVCFNEMQEITMDQEAEGGVVGWSAIIPPHQYTLSAYAVEDCELLEIHQADIQRLCEANTRLGFQFMTNTAQIIGQRYEITRRMLVAEIQHNFKVRHID